jgi:hypothetical protein
MYNARPKSLFFLNKGFRHSLQRSLPGYVQNSFSLMLSATGLIDRVADSFADLRDEDLISFERRGRIVEARAVYTNPSRRNMMSMTAITIRMWIQLPVRGKLELTFRPKKPSSHSITRTTMIIQISDDMRFLLCVLILYGQNLNCPSILWVG